MRQMCRGAEVHTRCFDTESDYLSSLNYSYQLSIDTYELSNSNHTSYHWDLLPVPVPVWSHAQMQKFNRPPFLSEQLL